MGKEYGYTTYQLYTRHDEHLMLIHFGTDDRRTDKFYNGYLDKMIKTLKRKGYTFVPVLEATGI